MIAQEATVRQEAIIEAALRRFSQFGVNKTTLSEIAGDLNISKPLLFYYFNDKESLIIAVFEKLVKEFHQTLKSKIKENTTAEDGILFFIDTKSEMLRNNMQLALQASDIEINRASPKLLKVIGSGRNETIRMLAELFNRGIEKQRIKPTDVKHTIRLIIETIQSCEHGAKKNLPFPTENDINKLVERQKEIVRLFFNGLQTANEREN